MERYDPVTDLWVAVEPMGTARLDCFGAVLDGKIYVAGGIRAKSDSEGEVDSDWASLALVECYDPITREWSLTAPMGTPRTNAGAAVLDGKLYVAGGISGDASSGSECNSVERYDPLTDAWEAVAPMNSSRGSASLAVVGGRLYATGGSDAESVYATVEIYDPLTNSWQEEEALMEEYREEHAAAALDGKLYVAGGHATSRLNGGPAMIRGSRNAEFFDPEADVWEAVAETRNPRLQCSCAVLDGKLFLAGGSYEIVTPLGGGASSVSRIWLDSLECYDPSLNVWNDLAPMKTKRTNFMLCSWGEF